MPIRDLTAAHIAAQGGAFEPQRGNNGLLRIVGVPGNMVGPSKGEDILTLSLNGFGLPTVSVEALETSFLNEKRKIAGTANFEDIEVTYKDFVDIGTAHICKLWHEQVYSPYTGKIGLARNYKKSGTIELFAPDGSHLRYYFLQGLWPTSFTPGTIDMTSAEPIMITMTLSIDKAFAAPDIGIASLLPQVSG